MGTPFIQPSTPVAGSPTLSALTAALPLVVVFVLLGGLRVRAWVAAAAGLGTAVVIAVLAFGMPAHLTVLAAAQGATFGVFPIMWIVLAALWLYELTVTSGRFEDLRAVFDTVSADTRIQAVLIAFCFGGLLEALAGFGAPVAITATMLIALGLDPIRAACTVLLANTAPVAFGAVAIPITTAATLTGLPVGSIASLVGRQAPLLAAVVPLLLLAVVDGRRGVREVWPAALVTGVSFAAAQAFTSNVLSVELTDVVAALVGLGATVAFVRVWHPPVRTEVGTQAGTQAGTPARPPVRPQGGAGSASRVAPRRDLTPERVRLALFPYLLVIVVFSATRLIAPLRDFLAGTDIKIGWPGLDGNVLAPNGHPVSGTVYTLPWLSGPGSLLLACGMAVVAVYRMDPDLALDVFVRTAVRLRVSILTVATVLALAYVMNLSGQTGSIGVWVAGTGGLFAFLSPVLGWVGTAVTGSDTSANALFGKLQATAATQVGIDPNLLVAANTTGGVVGKMVSPQNLTIAATSVGLPGQESVLLRRMLPWSLGLLLVLCTLVYLQSTPVLNWMVR